MKTEPIEGRADCPQPAAASPLVTKSEHLAGRKTLALEYRWGEPVTITLRPLGWRQLQLLTARSIEQNLNAAEHSELIVKASITGSLPENILDQLDADSASLLQRTALAFSLGEKAIKNAVAGAGTASSPIPPTPSSNAG